MSNSPWIPLEANPDVLTTWAQKAGLKTDSGAFHDVYGFEKELLDMVPGPVKALLFLFPVTPALEDQRLVEDGWIRSPEGKTHVNQNVFFIEQTISNACGTIALLHTLVNTNAVIGEETPLANFLQRSISLSPHERAQLLEKTDLFASIHESTAQMGQSDVPTDLDTNLHFIAYIEARDPVDRSSRLLEFDGRRPGPFDRGPCTDFLQPKLNSVVKDACRCIREHYISGNENMTFNLIAFGASDT